MLDPALRRRGGLGRAEKINSSYVSRVLRLTLLVPEIVEAVLDRRQPEGTSLPGLTAWTQNGRRAASGAASG